MLVAGDYFGEVSLLTRSRRTATVIVSEVASIASLSKATFDDIIKLHPELAISLRTHFDR